MVLSLFAKCTGWPKRNAPFLPWFRRVSRLLVNHKLINLGHRKPTSKVGKRLNYGWGGAFLLHHPVHTGGQSLYLVNWVIFDPPCTIDCVVYFHPHLFSIPSFPFCTPRKNPGPVRCNLLQRQPQSWPLKGRRNGPIC